MSKLEQVLEIDPRHELKFRGPFDVPVVSFLKLTNPTNNYVLFKIKTTAPRKYCVRPNSGFLVPKGKTLIQVCLQPFDYEPNEKNKHKFMVQSVVSTITAYTSPEEVWKSARPDELMDTKLKCVFEFPESDGQTGTTPVSVQGSNDDTRVIGDSASNTDGELVKAKKEVSQLLEEETNLRQENIKLKEELLQFQRQMASARASASRQQMQSPSLFQTPVIVLAVLIGVVGYILGKFLL